MYGNPEGDPYDRSSESHQQQPPRHLSEQRQQESARGEYGQEGREFGQQPQQGERGRSPQSAQPGGRQHTGPQGIHQSQGGYDQQGHRGMQGQQGPRSQQGMQGPRSQQGMQGQQGHAQHGYDQQGYGQEGRSQQPQQRQPQQYYQSQQPQQYHQPEQQSQQYQQQSQASPRMQPPQSMGGRQGGRSGMGLQPVTLEDVVRTDVVTADPDERVSDVVARMAEENVGSVVVVEEGRPVGIVTDRTVALALHGTPDVAEKQVEDLVPEDLVTATTDASVFDAVDTMREAGIRRLPVVGEEGDLEGIVTLDDVVVLLCSELGDAAEVIESQMPRS
ncbi:CBS domain-containing protein [Halorarum salinum]|nr:CBS domain-containing protein [Halobaculum salinum]